MAVFSSVLEDLMPSFGLLGNSRGAQTYVQIKHSYALKKLKKFQKRKKTNKTFSLHNNESGLGHMTQVWLMS